MKIYLDGDGPIQDFAAWMDEEGIPLGYGREDTERMFHERLDRVFLDSPASKYCRYFFDLYCAMSLLDHQVHVLTAVGDHWPNQYDKMQAMQNKMDALVVLGFEPDDIIIVDSGSDKIPFAIDDEGRPAVLYDDKWSTIKKWEEAGGLGFFVPECGLKHNEAGIDNHTPEG